MTTAKPKMKNASVGRDASLREFERRDRAVATASAGTGVVARARQPTSILLSEELLVILLHGGRKRKQKRRYQAGPVIGRLARVIKEPRSAPQGPARWQ
jgi:hypothetical protein